MKKIIHITGMSCKHCQARVEKALNTLEGTKAKVDLKKNLATVSMRSEITDVQLREAVEDAGYEVESIEVPA